MAEFDHKISAVIKKYDIVPEQFMHFGSQLIQSAYTREKVL